MLILKRKAGETIMIGHDIEVVILGYDKGQIKVGIKAPKDQSVHRKEIYDKINKEGANTLMEHDNV